VIPSHRGAGSKPCSKRFVILARIVSRGWSTPSPHFGSPAHVLHYLARYTHRVAISNHRLVDVTDDTVSFRWKDYRHGSQVRTLTLDVDEFLRRFLLHVLPKRFVRIRYFGFLASRCRTRGLPQCRQAIGDAPLPPVEPPHTARPPATWPCPRCGGPMRIVERLTARQLFLHALFASVAHDTSWPTPLPRQPPLVAPARASAGGLPGRRHRRPRT
jgi:Putative transposase